MSVRVMTDVWAIDLPDSQKIVLLALADSANDEGHCWPSMATLAKKCSKGERTIQGVIKQLVDAGHLTRKEVRGKGCNYYVHPRTDCATADIAPPQRTANTPAVAADKPSRTIIKKNISAHEMPDDWQPMSFKVGSASRDIVDSWPPGIYVTTLESFVAYHRSRGNKFKNWQDAWSTWVLNSRKFKNGATNRTTGQPRNQNGFAAALRYVADGRSDEPF
jgi:hypothetical protein